jgi:transposase
MKKPRWSDEKLKTLIKLWEENTPTKEIALKLNTSLNSLSVMVSYLRKKGVPLTLRKRGREKNYTKLEKYCKLLQKGGSTNQKGQ